MDMTDVLLFSFLVFNLQTIFCFYFFFVLFFSVDFFFRFIYLFIIFVVVVVVVVTTVTVAKEFAVLLCEFLLFIRIQGKQNSCMGYYGI